MFHVMPQADYMKSAQPRSGTLAVRAFRQRMRDQGLVKKDVWIRPVFAAELAAIEQRLRTQEGPAGLAPSIEGNEPGWSIESIRLALSQSSAVHDRRVSLELIEGTDPALHLVMHEHGDLSVFLAVGGNQIIVESFLWPLSLVRDPAEFNAHVLRTHKLLPLSTISLDSIGGVPGYTMFGALDTHATLASLMFEIETLADNVALATEIYAPFLRHPEAGAA